MNDHPWRGHRVGVLRGGLSAERLSFAGYAEYAPVVPNADAKTRARNRRIEILVME